MSRVAYFVKGTAKIRMTGYARLIDEDGNITRELDLSLLHEVECPVIDRMYGHPDDQFGVGFNIENVFEGLDDDD